MRVYNSEHLMINENYDRKGRMDQKLIVQAAKRDHGGDRKHVVQGGEGQHGQDSH